jgi:hypothetical protein
MAEIQVKRPVYFQLDNNTMPYDNRMYRINICKFDTKLRFIQCGYRGIYEPMPYVDLEGLFYDLFPEEYRTRNRYIIRCG